MGTGTVIDWPRWPHPFEFVYKGDGFSWPFVIKPAPGP